MKHKGIRIALAVIEACSGLCDKKRDKQPLAYADLPLIESRRQPLLGPRRVPRPRSSSRVAWCRDLAGMRAACSKRR